MKRPVEILSPAEVQALIDACASPRSMQGTRDRALLAVLYRAGLRCDEALSLMPKDIDAARGTLRVLHGKGDKARTVAVDADTLGMLASWMERRTKLPIGPDAPVFCTLTSCATRGLVPGQSIWPQQIRLMFKRLGRKAGIAKRVHPHGLRHTFASECRREGVDVGIISKALGHSSISTTVRYLDHIQPQDVIDAMKARTWTQA